MAFVSVLEQLVIEFAKRVSITMVVGVAFKRY
jgi:hypothetical protein